MKTPNLTKQTQSVELDAKGIDLLSERISSALAAAGVNQKDVIRLRLSAEDILDLWRKHLPPGSSARFVCGTHFGKQYIHIRVKGEKLDPYQNPEDESGAKDALNFGEYFYGRLLAQAGLALSYSYKGGENVLSIYPPKKQKSNPIVTLLIAILAAAVCGWVSGFLPEGAQSAVSSVVDPLFDTMLGALRALSSPLIFLAICCGIISIGDISALGKIGKTILSRAVICLYLILGITALGTVWFFPSSGTAAAGDGGSAFEQIYSMLLAVIPKDICSPFIDGNALQIIFLGICVGTALLILGEKVSSVMMLLEQLNEVIQLLMSGFGKLIPLFVFLSIYSLMSSDSLGLLGHMVKGVALILLCCLLWPLIYTLVLSLKLKVSCRLMIRKLFPTFLIGVTTGSSAAAFTTNLETCEKKFGIPGRITQFAIPLEQVIFMPIGAVAFLLMAMSMAEMFGIAVTPSWMLANIIVSGLVAMAAPPIPGGSLSCFTILFTQLGLPAEAITLAIAANVLLEFLETAGNLSCLQAELTLATAQLDMLDLETLRKE